jgi:hypothetical protein
MATSDTTAPEPIAAAKKLALARRGTPGRSRRLAIVQPFVSFRTQRLIASMHAIVRMTLFAGINAAAGNYALTASFTSGSLQALPLCGRSQLIPKNG